MVFDEDLYQVYILEANIMRRVKYGRLQWAGRMLEKIIADKFD